VKELVVKGILRETLSPCVVIASVVDAKHAINLKMLQLVMYIRHRASLITYESGVLGKDPLRPFRTWGLK